MYRRSLIVKWMILSLWPAVIIMLCLLNFRRLKNRRLKYRFRRRSLFRTLLRTLLSLQIFRRIVLPLIIMKGGRGKDRAPGLMGDLRTRSTEGLMIRTMGGRRKIMTDIGIIRIIEGIGLIGNSK